MDADYNNATLDNAIEMALFAALIGKRHCVPGKVVSFNSAEQTIIAEPMICAEGSDGAKIPLPPVADVPLFQLGGGEFIITVNPKAGDPCLLLVSDRAIDDWFETNESRIPADYRQNDLSDCFAFVGFRPKPLLIKNWMQGITIRKVDGSHYINIADDGKTTIKALSLLVDAENSEFTGNVKIDKDLYVQGGTTFIGNVDGGGATARFKDATIADITYSGHRHKENGDGGGVTDAPQ